MNAIGSGNQPRAYLVALTLVVCVLGAGAFAVPEWARGLGLAAGAVSLAAAVLAWKTGRGAAVPAERGDFSDAEQLSARLITVQEEERTRLSRELHDGVGQTITALKMELARLATPAAEGDAVRLERARAHADEALRTIRNASLLLRPTLLDDLGLDAALEWHAQDFRQRTGIQCELRYSLPDAQALPEAVRTCVYRTVQEALNNCEKHANAGHIRVDISADERGLRVSIADNGWGIQDATKSPRLGILGMRERASMLGGNLTVESNTGQGTRVTLFVPATALQ